MINISLSFCHKTANSQNDSDKRSVACREICKISEFSMSSTLAEIWLFYQFENFSSIYPSNNKSPNTLYINITPAHCKSVLLTIYSDGSVYLSTETLLPMVVNKTLRSFCV